MEPECFMKDRYGLLEGLWSRRNSQPDEGETGSIGMQSHLVIVVRNVPVGAELLLGLLSDRFHQTWVFDEVEKAPR
jgi:hypothetical protein